MLSKQRLGAPVALLQIAETGFLKTTLNEKKLFTTKFFEQRL